MPSWLLKAAAQKALSLLPASQACNYLVQKHVTGSIALDKQRLKLKINYARRHLQIWHSINRVSLDGITAYELGTGWYPVLPVILYLCGARQVWTIDKTPLLRREHVIKTIRLLAQLLQDGELTEDLPWLKAERVQNLLTVSRGAEDLSASGLLAQFNIVASVQDARQTDIQQGSVQFLLSNSVLQEVPKDILLPVFREFRRIMSGSGTMIHYINMVEPYVGCDPTLTAYHFLQFSDSTWKYINNSLHYHNRLRMTDYRSLHNSSGFQIFCEENEKGADRELNSIRLAAPFRQYPREDLKILRTWIASGVVRE